jgi:RNA polymerase II elongation factor ELL
MQLEMTQDVVDELLESARSGKLPQILFGRTPQLKYGDKTHVLQTSSESFRHELYQSSSAGSDNDLRFAGLINHSLAVQRAEEHTSGVDPALEQLKSSMAAISELKEANKTIVGNASPMYPSGRRAAPKSLKPQHLRPSSNFNSPLRTNPSSPALPALPQHMSSGPSAITQALRRVLIHLIASGPHSENWLRHNARASQTAVKEVLTKIAKKDDLDKYTLMDKAFKELDPFNFPYQASENRQSAIDNAIKAFDRMRLAKDDKLWQVLLPEEERGKGKCLSRLNVQAPAQKPATPLHKITKAIEKKPAAEKKSDSKDGEKEAKKPKEVKEKKAAKTDAEKAAPSTKVTATKAAKTAKAAATPSEPAKSRKKAPVAESSAAPRPKPKPLPRDASAKGRVSKPAKPALNTKPKNPSPLSASPPVNASDFEDDHPVHKALSAAPSPAKSSTQSSGNSDHSLKRKANDLDNNIHSHAVPTKAPRRDVSAQNNTPSNGKPNGATPSSSSSLKRKTADDSSTPSTTPVAKYRKVTGIDTKVAARYQTTKATNVISPGESSSTTTSPTVPTLSFRQAVEMSQKFEKYYKRYSELYYKLAESPTPPTDAQRAEVLKMHHKLAEMKREINAGASAKH